MQFVYQKNAGENILVLQKEIYTYIIKARRHKVGDKIIFRNYENQIAYTYYLEDIQRKEAKLVLMEQKKYTIKPDKHLHLGWCKIDEKNIEKTLPFLNELGITCISFIGCDYSQQNIKINQTKLRRILENSNMQSGRTDFIKFYYFESLDKYISSYPKAMIVSFSKNMLPKVTDNFIIGCEGGFSQRELKLVDSMQIVGLKNKMILKSQTAAINATALLL